MPAFAGMTDVGKRLARLIDNSGPISVAHYMAEANAHYYATRDPLGAAGDFTTAPEISQMFGELIGLSLADLWMRAGAPADAAYVELGPGRGTLAEHLADLGRGGEVAGDAERFARRVIAVLRVEEAGRHVVGDADRPRSGDRRRNAARETVHAGAAALGGRAVAIAHAPARTIGSESTMPMVSQPVPSR